MNKLYQRINWRNYPSDSTPLNESNLNKMDAAVDGIDDRVVTLDVTKLPVATANTMVKDVTFNETTGVFTITKLNGTKVTVNTALEKIATNFRFDHSTQKLILTLIDGTTQEVDLSALLTQYEFLNSSTIQFTIDSSGKVKASVVNGSITGDMLEPNYLANVTLQASKADTSAKNAKESEEKAAEYAESAKNSADSAEPVASTATGKNPTIQDSTNAPLIYGKFKGYTLQDGEPAPDNPVEINGLAKDGAIEVGTTGILSEETTANIPTDAPLYEGDYLEVYADGSGKLVRAMAEVVFDGSDDETWLYGGTADGIANAFKKDISDVKRNIWMNVNKQFCSHFKVDAPGYRTYDCFSFNNTKTLIIQYGGATDVDTFKAWLQSNPVTVVYELAEPTETPLTAEQVEQFKKLYTFEPVTNVLCDGETEIQYYKNTPSGVAVGTVHRMADNNKATYDGDGNVITETYAKQTDLEKVIDGTTTVAKATSATTATKATQDADGNNIVNTYAKKSSVLSTVSECEASTTDTDIAGASALAELNNSLKTPNYESVTIDEYTTTIYYRKVLNMVELNIVGGSYNIQPNSEVTLCTLPEGYRPKRGFPIPEGYGKPDVRFYIGGEIILQNHGTEQKGYVAGHCVYLV